LIGGRAASGLCADERETLRRLVDRRRREQLEDALADSFLREMLEEGPRRLVEVEWSAKYRGSNPRIPLEALERAKRQLGVVEEDGWLRAPPLPSRGP
jgi:hypothetical protein